LIDQRKGRQQQAPPLGSYGPARAGPSFSLGRSTTAGQGVVWYTGQFYALSFLTITLKLDYLTAVAATGNIYAGLWYPIGVVVMTLIVGAIFLRQRCRHGHQFRRRNPENLNQLIRGAAQPRRSAFISSPPRKRGFLLRFDHLHKCNRD
jgi:hypothetical protein